MSAPSAADLHDPLVEHLLVLHRELTTEGVVVKGIRAALGHHIETRQVSASGAAVASKGHRLKLPARP